jgi:lactate dehydrogenase-like 2-hydroxyacid dehydrogenase
MDTVLFMHRLPVEAYADLLRGCSLIIPESADKPFSRAELLQKIAQADALVCTSDTPCDKELIAAGRRLRVIATVSVGYNHIDLAAAAAAKIPVVNTPHTVTEPTAELAVGLMFCCARSIAANDRELRKNLKWDAKVVPVGDLVLTGATLGVLGFGRIGRCVAKKAVGLGMKVVYYDIQRAPEDLERSFNATWMPAEKVLAEADVVTLHMPYTPESHHYINEERLALMKPTAILINTARGSIVSEKALIEALSEHKIRAAGLDVFEKEPTISPEMAKLDNLVMTPHAGTKIYSERLKMLGEALQGAVSLLRGEKPHNIVP